MQKVRAFVVACVVVGVFGCGQVDARRSLSKAKLNKVNKTWETLMGNRLVMTYFSLGVLGDMFRSKVYNAKKTQRYLKTLNALIQKEKTFLKDLKLPRGDDHKELFAKIRATVELMSGVAESLKEATKGKASEMKQFLVYRNSIAQDVAKILANATLKKQRRYPGKAPFAYGALSHQLGADLSLGYLVVGLVADGYFRLVLDRKKALEFLETALPLIKASGRKLRAVQDAVPEKDKTFVNGWKRVAIHLLREGYELRKFIRTRKRVFLLRYRHYRKTAWAALSKQGS
ncbi:MAG TPA: hypothetical protein DCE42_28910 [Myxococcales bacterium]|nr:hypothetical protein [Myxococcales bacterium]